MGVVSLLVGLVRLALLGMPIVAIAMTSRDVMTVVAVSLLWTVQLFKGLGYDVVQHYLGTEANLYTTALLAIKTVPYIEMDAASLEYWVPVLFVELVYYLAHYTPLAAEFDNWRFSAKQQQALKTTGRVEHQLISWRSTLLLAVVVTGFNAVRVGLLAGAAEGTLDLSYNDEGTLLLWSYLAESVVALLMVVRLRSLYTPSSTDFWRDAGGVVFIYLFYQLVTLWILPTPALFGVTIAMIACTVLALVAVDKQVSANTDNWFEYLGEVLVQWLYELVGIVFSEPVAQVLFVAGCAITAYGSLWPWYSTTTTFPSFVRQITCAPAGLINGPIQVLYRTMSNPRWANLVAIIDLFISRNRIKATNLLTTTYGAINGACNGYTLVTTPLLLLWLTPFLALPWFAGLLVCLQVFPEARRIVTMSGFWALTFVLCLVSFTMVQFLADIKVTIFYLFLDDTTVEREYTDEGRWVLMVQLFQMILLLTLFYNRHRDEVTLEELSPASARKPGVLVKSIGTVGRVIDEILAPELLLWGASAFLFVVSLMLGPPIDHVTVVPYTDETLPDWLLNAPGDSFTGQAANLAGALSYRLKGILALSNLAQFVLQEAGNLSHNFSTPFPPPYDYVEIPFSLASVLGNALGTVTTWLSQGLDFTATKVFKEIVNAFGNSTISIVNEAFEGLPDLDQFTPRIPGTNFTQVWSVFSLPQIDAVSINYPPWLLPILLALAAAAIIASFISLVYGGVFKTISRMFFMGAVGLLASAVVFVLNIYLELQSYGYKPQITWSSTGVLPFAFSLVLFVSGFVLWALRLLGPQPPTTDR
jgi:hypothetical protein